MQSVGGRQVEYELMFAGRDYVDHEARRFQNIMETPLMDILSKDYYDLPPMQLKAYMEFHEIQARVVAMPRRAGFDIDPYLDDIE